MCTHVAHFIRINSYFFSFFQFWQKKFGKTPHFCKFFEVGGAFAFLSEKMRNYKYKTYQIVSGMKNVNLVVIMRQQYCSTCGTVIKNSNFSKKNITEHKILCRLSSNHFIMRQRILNRSSISYVSGSGTARS